MCFNRRLMFLFNFQGLFRVDVIVSETKSLGTLSVQHRCQWKSPKASWLTKQRECAVEHCLSSKTLFVVVMFNHFLSCQKKVNSKPIKMTTMKSHRIPTLHFVFVSLSFFTVVYSVLVVIALNRDSS